MQEQQQQTVKLGQRLRVAIQVLKIFLKATRQDTTALQYEDLLVMSFEQLHISEQTIQAFKDRLEKVRQSAPHAYLEDTYIMGGILIYCGILLPVLISLGIPDLASRIAWIAFTVSFPGAVGFFLARFLKERNSISVYGRLHSVLATLTEIGVVVMTAGLLFHIWNVVGWLFLGWAIVILFGYAWYRFMIYFTPLLVIFRDILKTIEETPPPGKQDATTINHTDQPSP